MLTAYSSGCALDKIRSQRFPGTKQNARHRCKADDEAMDDFDCVSALSNQSVKKRGYLTSLYPVARRTPHEKASQPCSCIQSAKGHSFKGRNTPSNRFQRQCFSFERSEFPGRPWHPPARSSECAERASTLQLSSRFCGQRIRALRPD